MGEDYARLLGEDSKVQLTQQILENFTRANSTLVPEYSDTWSSYLSNDAFTQSTEGQGEDVHMMEPGKEEISEPAPERKRRGRKPLRPLDPVRKKTEEKDKYWLRAFRAYMRAYYPTVRDRLPQDEQVFWDFHLSSTGKPGKGNRYCPFSFASYGKNYKQFIFSHPSFSMLFRQWFCEFGDFELTKKCPRSTDLWVVFHDYAARDLYYFNELQTQMHLGSDSPLLVAETSSIPPDGFSLDVDMTTPDKFADAMLSLSPLDDSCR